MSKKFYYLGVQTDDGLVLVTSVDYKNRTCEWDSDKMPIAMTKAMAEDLSNGLCSNLIISVVVSSLFEFESQPFVVELFDSTPKEPDSDFKINRNGKDIYLTKQELYSAQLEAELLASADSSDTILWNILSEECPSSEKFELFKQENNDLVSDMAAQFHDVYYDSHCDYDYSEQEVKHLYEESVREEFRKFSDQIIREVN